MKITIIGHGAVSSALIPILASELRSEITSLKVIAPNVGTRRTNEHGICADWIPETLTIENYKHILNHLDNRSLLINLSVDVGTLDLVELCQERGARYLDTCIEPWAGYYFDKTLSPVQRSNYSLRESLLARKLDFQGGPTAVIAHGANPGLVSHFTKQALLTISRDLYGANSSVPASRQEWAQLAWQLGIKAIHIAEHDTQLAKVAKIPGVFINTWSVDGLISEGCQPSELGWGTHELKLPDDADYHSPTCKSSIYFNRPGVSIRLKTWTPAYGPCLGFLITHNESLSLSEYFTHSDNDRVIYRPTVNYAYHPCNDTVLSIHEFIGNSWRHPKQKRVLKGDQISHGADYLGVLLMGHEKNAYWYGSSLSNSMAQHLNPASSATTLQVAAGVLAGVKWAISNPRRGIVEAEDMDFSFVLDIAQRYLGEMIGVYTDWNPTRNNEAPFPANSNTTSIWQFENFLE